VPAEGVVTNIFDCSKDRVTTVCTTYYLGGGQAAGEIWRKVLPTRNKDCARSKELERVPVVNEYFTTWVTVGQIHSMMAQSGSAGVGSARGN